MYGRPYVSLRYNKQNMNSNISETQYKQLQAQGYYLRFKMFLFKKYPQTRCKLKISQKKEPRLLFFRKKSPCPSLNSNLTTRRSTIEIRSFVMGFFFPRRALPLLLRFYSQRF